MKDLCWIAVAVAVISIALQFHQPEEKPKQTFHKNYDNISMRRTLVEKDDSDDSPTATSITEFEHFL